MTREPRESRRRAGAASPKPTSGPKSQTISREQREADQGPEPAGGEEGPERAEDEHQSRFSIRTSTRRFSARPSRVSFGRDRLGRRRGPRSAPGRAGAPFATRMRAMVAARASLRPWLSTKGLVALTGIAVGVADDGDGRRSARRSRRSPGRSRRSAARSPSVSSARAERKSSGSVHWMTRVASETLSRPFSAGSRPCGRGGLELGQEREVDRLERAAAARRRLDVALGPEDLGALGGRQRARQRRELLGLAGEAQREQRGRSRRRAPPRRRRAPRSARRSGAARRRRRRPASSARAARSPPRGRAGAGRRRCAPRRASGRRRGRARGTCRGSRARGR